MDDGERVTTAQHTAPEEVCWLDLLPDEALFAIFSHLHPRYSNRLHLVCSNWHRLVDDNLLWCPSPLPNVRASRSLLILLPLVRSIGRNGASRDGTTYTPCRSEQGHGRRTIENAAAVRLGREFRASCAGWMSVLSLCLCGVPLLVYQLLILVYNRTHIVRVSRYDTVDDIMVILEAELGTQSLVRNA